MRLSAIARTNVVAALAVASVAGPAFAEPGSDAAAGVLRALFASPATSAALFSPDFAREVPPATILRYVAFYERAIGVPTAIVRDPDANAEPAEYELTAPHGSLRASIALDRDGTIAALRFHDELTQANADALKRLLAANVLAADWFAETPQRTRAVARTQKVVDALHTALGAYVRLETRRGAYVAIFERGETHVQISTDNSGRIAYLSFERS